MYKKGGKKWSIKFNMLNVNMTITEPRIMIVNHGG